MVGLVGEMPPLSQQMQGVIYLQRFFFILNSVVDAFRSGNQRPSIPVWHIKTLGAEGIALLRKQLEMTVETDICFAMDRATNSVVVLPVEEDDDDGNDSQVSARVPRPPNAFILYRKHWHATVVAENPAMHNNDISVIIGKMWQNECPALKLYYKEQSEELKKQHALDYPDYQYQPRRPSEKKRRMTKNKLAKLAEEVNTMGMQNGLPQNFEASTMGNADFEAVQGQVLADSSAYSVDPRLDSTARYDQIHWPQTDGPVLDGFNPERPDEETLRNLVSAYYQEHREMGTTFNGQLVADLPLDTLFQPDPLFEEESYGNYNAFAQSKYFSDFFDMDGAAFQSDGENIFATEDDEMFTTENDDIFMAETSGLTDAGNFLDPNLTGAL